MNQNMLHLFYIRSAFEYFFSTVLIDHLGLENVTFIMNEPREGIETRVEKRFSTIHTKDGLVKRFGSRTGSKLVFVGRVFRELELAGKRVSLYSPVFNETFIDGLRDRMERRCQEVHYFMIPDGAALLRHFPRPKSNPYALLQFVEMGYRIERADRRHTSGSYSGFIEKVYHYPAKGIHADSEKIEIVPVPTSDKHHSNEVLVIGGRQGISKEFVEEANRISDGSTVRYRMHPHTRSGEEFIHEHGRDWRELSIEGALEEHLLEHPYRLVIGPYSTVLMFNHLFVSDSESRFLIDADNEDTDWQATAEASEIPVIRIAETVGTDSQVEINEIRC